MLHTLRPGLLLLPPPLAAAPAAEGAKAWEKGLGSCTGSTAAADFDSLTETDKHGVHKREKKIATETHTERERERGKNEASRPKRRASRQKIF